MTLASGKGSPGMASFPKNLSSVAVSAGGLALFLICTSWLLVSYPISSTVQEYFYGVENSGKFDLPISLVNQSSTESHLPKNLDVIDKNYPSASDSQVPSEPNLQVPMLSVEIDEKVDLSSLPPTSSYNLSQQEVKNNPGTVDTRSNETIQASSDSKFGTVPSFSPQSSNASRGCNLYQGSWFYDSSGPSYTNNTCPIITQMQNCQGNGRPDKDYENWRWKPLQCDLPKFDARKFLQLMRGKTLAFIGDSVARNQMESMLCLLWQVEVPKNRGNKRMQRYYFLSTNVTIIRIWSSWLVHKTSEPFDIAPESVIKLHLDAPDWDFMEYIPNFDVLVLSSGHWFAKQSVYMLNNEVVGGQLWWPKDSPPMKVNNIDAFGISVETILTALATHPNYTGLTIVRSFSPDHYEGGAWNTGGSCTGKVHPLAAGKLVDNAFTNIMHEKQVTGFNRAIKKANNKSKLHLMDITGAFGYRHDGHPGPYRSLDPNKITKRGSDGKPPPQDCLHWCMPGPVDGWNELVLEVIRREFENDQG